MRYSRLALLAVAVGCGSDKATAPSDVVTDPARAVFVTSDIQHFWTAYDADAQGGTSAFQTEYLDRASPGLRDFIASRTLTAASLGNMVRTYPRYFAGIRASTGNPRPWKSCLYSR